MLQELGAYLRGGCQYFRHGQSASVFQSLDRFVSLRVARNLARGQPTGRKRRQRRWVYYVSHPALKQVPTLARLKQGPFEAYRGQAKVGWRAV